jgi:NAD(P)-dependent dehydrogenase (short-subunit alcohol dehydrogenase family)
MADETPSALKDVRLLVVGASSGIGREFAIRATQAGASTVLVARRKDLLGEVAAEAGGGHVIAGDVANPQECARVVAEAIRVLGGIDVLLYCVGYAPLRAFAETSADDWRDVFAANVIGLHQIICAALPALSNQAIVAAISSESVAQPRSALGAYASSKAALEQVMRVWRVERPTVRFLCIAIGATVPTEFGRAFEGEVLGASLDNWLRHGLIQEQFMATAELANVLIGLLAAALPYPGIGIEHITLRSPSAVMRAAG